MKRLSMDNSREVAESLMRALAELRDASLPDVAALFDQPDERLWTAAAEIMARMGVTAAPALRRALGHRSVEVRT